MKEVWGGGTGLFIHGKAGKEPFNLSQPGNPIQPFHWFVCVRGVGGLNGPTKWFHLRVKETHTGYSLHTHRAKLTDPCSDLSLLPM